MKSFKSTASKIKNPRLFFNKSPNEILNGLAPCVLPSQGRARVGGPMHTAPPCTPLHIPDLKCNLERVPGDKNTFLILTLFSSNFRLFTVRSYNNRSNIFKNAFYVFVFFGTMGSFLLIAFVLARELSFPRNDAQS